VLGNPVEHEEERKCVGKERSYDVPWCSASSF
jgi:hypothetical protein